MLARKNKGYSLNEVAERTGIATSTLSRYENGFPGISIDYIYKLISCYETDANIFFTNCIAKMQN